MINARYRGKSLETGEWVYGRLSYCQHVETNAVVDCITTEDIQDIPVDPSTVGQLVSGKGVYQGDILSCINGDEEEYITKVTGFGVVDVFFCDYDSTLLGWALGNGVIQDYDVIGNIHDNPEFMGGES